MRCSITSDTALGTVRPGLSGHFVSPCRKGRGGVSCWWQTEVAMSKRWWQWVAVVAVLGTAACESGTGGGVAGGGGQDADIAVGDSAEPADSSGASDTSTGKDIAADSDATAGSDATSDTPFDTAVDSGGDTVADAASDVAVDAAADAGTEAGSDAGPAPGCCGSQSDCKADQVCFSGPFNAGKCMTITGLGKGQCWTDGQCAKGQACTDAMACGCNAQCKAMDKPGSCAPVGEKACSVGALTVVPCATDEYCALASGCTGDGVCKAKPEMCTAEYAPVCGCNGQTYSNGCSAAGAGQNQKSAGECNNPCMTMKCGDGNPCTADTCNPKTGKCEFPVLVGSSCDDGNPCTAGDTCSDVGGVGKCLSGKENPDCGSGSCSLGTGADAPCAAGEFCKLPDGQCTGTGACTATPQVCMTVYMPVCGCNGKTYGNTCEANGSGQNWAGKGECGGAVDGTCCKQDSDCKSNACAGTTCVNGDGLKPGQCWTTSQCPAGTACKGANVCPCGAMCLVADKPGTCQ